MVHELRTNGMEAVRTEECRSAGAADVLVLCREAALAERLRAVCERMGWSVAAVETIEAAMEWLGRGSAAVVLCGESFQDGGWRDAAQRLNAVPRTPMMVLVGNGRVSVDEVFSCGAFDALPQPLSDADLIWTVACAWHQWMDRYEAEGQGGALCSDA